MKKILYILSAVMMLTGCYRDDINDLKDEVERLKERMAQYEILLDALGKQLYVVSYEVKESYYIITMSDGSKLAVRNTSSFIEIGENGNWRIDGVDSGRPAKGDTPQISVGGNGNWWIGGEDTGVSSRGQSGKDASEIVSVAIVGGKMIFLFSDGRTISIDAATPDVSIAEPAGGFVIDKMSWLRIQPQVTNSEGIVYQWLTDGGEISGEKDLFCVFAEAGTYHLELKARNGMGESVHTITVTVNDRTLTNGVAHVFAYLPAPGQFINTMPEAAAGDTPETMRQKAETALTGGSVISLGGFGGYVVFGFDHTIINRSGNDFVVLGNTFSGSAEPGVIMVSYDANGNGLPDDEWYEIAGSEYHKPSTIKNYEITYYKPASEPTRPNEPEYIRWTDNQGQSGYLSKNGSHTQPYYPLWKGDSYTLKGTLMKANLYDQSGNGVLWVNQPFDWGYADNFQNTDVRAQIDMDWAVDHNGNPVRLKGIDFVKVYTANRAEGGWIGELSTEISGFTDLNL